MVKEILSRNIVKPTTEILTAQFSPDHDTIPRGNYYYDEQEEHETDIVSYSEDEEAGEGSDSGVRDDEERTDAERVRKNQEKKVEEHRLQEKQQNAMS